MNALALLLLTAASATSTSTTPVEASLDLVVFEDGLPQPGLELSASGVDLGRTDEAGSLSVRIPAGRQQVQLRRGRDPVLDLDLLTDAGEIVRIIVTLRPPAAPTLDIESSGQRSVLAAERAAARAEGRSVDVVAVAQAPGALVGTIRSIEDDNEPVKGARVFFSGTSVQVQTDREGRFAVELPPGLYSVSVVHPDFATQTKDNLRVIPGKEVTVELELTPAGIQLSDYVVSAPYVEGSIASTIEQQRSTSAVSEVLGAEQMAATGDSDAAEALQRVTGLTIDQGKYVLVRGQPYRYTYTLWNGSPLPSPEPLLRVVPLDLFPTGVLSGIAVQKSYSADKPGEFGAGLVELQTRGVPREGFFSLSLSGSYNSQATFQDGLTYDGGSTDIFGFDDGTRAPPPEVQAALQGVDALDELPEDEEEALGRTFANEYKLKDATLAPAFGITLTAGDSLDLPNEGRLGAVASAKWGTSWSDQARIQRRFAKAGDRVSTRNDFVEHRTDFNSDLGALLSVVAEWERLQFASNTFYAHLTQQRSQLTTGLLKRSDNGDLQSYLLSWIERQLVAQQLTASADLGVVQIEARGMLSAANRDAPDRRTYEYLDPEPVDGRYFVFGNGMSRESGTVDDVLSSFGLDLTVPILDPEEGWLGLEAKAGVAGSFQSRDAATRTYTWFVDDESGADLSETDPEVLYDPAQSGITLDFKDASRSYRDDSVGHLNVLGAYALTDLRLAELVRIVAGVRYERADMSVTTFQLTPEDESAQTGGFTQDPLLPSVSATWFATEAMQVRSSYGRTTSRPNLNELSDARFFDPDSGEGFVGEPELVPTVIDGVDLRWEWYPTPTESVTFGGFWKGYTNPIERTFTQVGGTDPLGTFQNAESARVLGVEVGGRFEFGHVREWLGGPAWIDDLYVLGNLAVLSSRVSLANAGVATNAERPLDGQASFALNAQAGYRGEDHDLTLAYNHVGRRLHRAGVQGLDDIYLEALPTLDLTWTWRIWKAEHTRGQLRLNGSNLTNPRLTWKQSGEVWRSYRRGLSVNASFAITFE